MNVGTIILVWSLASLHIDHITRITDLETEVENLKSNNRRRMNILQNN